MSKKYVYEVYKDGTKIFEGSSNDLKKRFYVSSVSQYASGKAKLCGEYTVTKKPYIFVPKKKQKYYYYSTLTETVQYDYWDIDDTNCLLRWNANNLYKTKTMASKFGSENMNKIKKEFLEQCLNYSAM